MRTLAKTLIGLSIATSLAGVALFVPGLWRITGSGPLHSASLEPGQTHSAAIERTGRCRPCALVLRHVVSVEHARESEDAGAISFAMPWSYEVRTDGGETIARGQLMLGQRRAVEYPPPKWPTAGGRVAVSSGERVRVTARSVTPPFDASDHQGLTVTTRVDPGEGSGAEIVELELEVRGRQQLAPIALYTMGITTFVGGLVGGLCSALALVMIGRRERRTNEPGRR